MPEAKTKLNKAEKFYILHHMDTLSLDILSKELRCSKKIIEKQVTLFRSKNNTKQISTGTKKENPDNPAMPIASDLMMRNAKYGVTIMTRQSSEISDESKKNAKKASVNTGYVHRTKKV